MYWRRRAYEKKSCLFHESGRNCKGILWHRKSTRDEQNGSEIRVLRNTPRAKVRLAALSVGIGFRGRSAVGRFDSSQRAISGDKCSGNSHFESSAADTWHAHSS